jgi:hypothetical protein
MADPQRRDRHATVRGRKTWTRAICDSDLGLGIAGTGWKSARHGRRPLQWSRLILFVEEIFTTERIEFIELV